MSSFFSFFCLKKMNQNHADSSGKSACTCFYFWITCLNHWLLKHLTEFTCTSFAINDEVSCRRSVFLRYNNLLTEIYEKNPANFCRIFKRKCWHFFKFKRECIFTCPIILLLHITVVTVSKWNCSQPFIPLHLLYHLTTIYWVNLVSSYNFDWFKTRQNWSRQN